MFQGSRLVTPIPEELTVPRHSNWRAGRPVFVFQNVSKAYGPIDMIEYF